MNTHHPIYAILATNLNASSMRGFTVNVGFQKVRRSVPHNSSAFSFVHLAFISLDVSRMKGPFPVIFGRLLSIPHLRQRKKRQIRYINTLIQRKRLDQIRLDRRINSSDCTFTFVCVRFMISAAEQTEKQKAQCCNHIFGKPLSFPGLQAGILQWIPRIVFCAPGSVNGIDSFYDY